MPGEQMMQESIEEYLLKYIDTPYFRNNPTYIGLWRSYYERHKDPQILLLMYYKQISTYYHWIYLELSKYFVKSGKPEIAQFVLSEAQKIQAYDGRQIDEALARLPPFERQYTRGDMLCILHQRNIRALGMLWNKYDEICFYEQRLDSESKNFEMMKTRHYLRFRGLRMPVGALCKGSQSNEGIYVDTARYSLDSGKNASIQATAREAVDGHMPHGHTSHSTGQVVVPDVVCNQGVMELKSTGEDKENCMSENSGLHTGPADFHCTKADVGVENSAIEMNLADELSMDRACTEQKVSAELGLNSQVNTDASIHCTEEAKKQQSGALFVGGLTVHEVSSTSINETEMEIDGYVHIIQEVADDAYITMRVAKNLNITQTIAGKNYCIKRISAVHALAVDKVYRYDYCKIDDYLYVMFEFDRLEDIAFVLQYCNPTTCLFYLRQVLRIVKRFLDEAYCLDQPRFFVDTGFNVAIAAFATEPATPDRILKSQEHLCSMFGGFGIDFSMGMEALLEDADRRLADKGSLKQLLVHKTAVLNAL